MLMQTWLGVMLWFLMKWAEQIGLNMAIDYKDGKL